MAWEAWKLLMLFTTIGAAFMAGQNESGMMLGVSIVTGTAAVFIL